VVRKLKERKQRIMMKERESRRNAAIARKVGRECGKAGKGGKKITKSPFHRKAAGFIGRASDSLSWGDGEREAYLGGEKSWGLGALLSLLGRLESCMIERKGSQGRIPKAVSGPGGGFPLLGRSGQEGEENPLYYGKKVIRA